MATSNPEEQKKLAVYIASTIGDAETNALRAWIEQMLAIKASKMTLRVKAQRAISLTSRSNIVVPVLKLVLRETKRMAWDDRGLQGKLAISGSAIGAALFGGQAAGVAALGTAVGVPLWVIFGAGASFLGVLYDEITRKQ